MFNRRGRAQAGDPGDWMAMISSMLHSETPGHAETLAGQMSVSKLSETDAAAGLGVLADRGLMVDRGGWWEFTEAGRRMMD